MSTGDRKKNTFLVYEAYNGNCKSSHSLDDHTYTNGDTPEFHTKTVHKRAV